jgi:hypothetical protein
VDDLCPRLPVTSGRFGSDRLGQVCVRFEAAEEAVHVDGVGDQAYDDGTCPHEDHGRDTDDGVEEPFELHADEGGPVGLAVHHHRVPGLDVPGSAAMSM